MVKAPRVPPGCGEALGNPLLFNPYQQDFQEARRQRFCLQCKTLGRMNPETGTFTCPKCKTVHVST
jgi:Zn finger protein HypA/HybF involved in hydrogenase expression